MHPIFIGQEKDFRFNKHKTSEVPNWSIAFHVRKQTTSTKQCFGCCRTTTLWRRPGGGGMNEWGVIGIGIQVSLQIELSPCDGTLFNLDVKCPTGLNRKLQRYKRKVTVTRFSLRNLFASEFPKFAPNLCFTRNWITELLCYPFPGIIE